MAQRISIRLQNVQNEIDKAIADLDDARERLRDANLRKGELLAERVAELEAQDN